MGGNVVLLLTLMLTLVAGAARAGDWYRVAVIDKFYPPLEPLADNRERELNIALYGLSDLDGDRRREPLYHGDLVTRVAKHPKLGFILYPLRSNGQPIAEILANLRELKLRQRRFPVDALLLCWESSTLISALTEALRVEQAAVYKQKIRAWGLTDAVWRDTAEIIDELEWFAAHNVMVVTIAGNGGRAMINTFSLAAGVVTVGAREPELAGFVADNPFVDLHAPAALWIRPLRDANGQVQGYDLDGDRCADIEPRSLSRQSPATGREVLLKGSSFAAPFALKRLLLGEASTPECVNALPASPAPAPVAAAVRPG